MNYTHAYCTFAIRTCLDPELPNNFGTLAPIKVTAPEGCIVNAISGRRSMRAMSSACMCQCRSSRRFTTSSRIGCWPKDRAQYGRCRSKASATTAAVHQFDVQLLWRHGRAADQGGPGATCYPTGVAAVPVEILEASMPIVFDRRELRLGSGGEGASRGGDGQTIGWRMRTTSRGFSNAVPSRLVRGPEGLGGGAPGAAGRFLVNGKP